MQWLEKKKREVTENWHCGEVDLFQRISKLGPVARTSGKGEEEGRREWEMKAGGE